MNIITHRVYDTHLSYLSSILLLLSRAMISTNLLNFVASDLTLFFLEFHIPVGKRVCFCLCNTGVCVNLRVCLCMCVCVCACVF